MKLSELEKLSDELLSGVPEDVFERNWTQEAIQCLNTLPVFCATFREMLEAMKYVQKDLDIRAHLMPDFDESDPCVYIGDGVWKGLCAAIKKAEEML